MAEEAEEEENYWPGYVDALSTMTMVLTFVMMILVVVVFMLIQNTSQSLIEARLENANVGGGGGTTQITEQSSSIADVETTAVNDGSPYIVTQAEVDRQEQNVQSVSVEDELQTETLEAAAVRDLDSQEAVTVSQEGLTVTFEDGNSGLDEAAMEVVRQFATESELGQSELTLEIMAFANTEDGNVTNVRRTAYYRAMMIRNQLMAAGLPPDRISVGVRDVQDSQQGNEVKVFGR